MDDLDFRKVGQPIDRDDPSSPLVVEVLIHKEDDSGRDVAIMRTNDGKWHARYDDSIFEPPTAVVAPTAQKLAQLLWKNGRCLYPVAEAMFRIGWLALDPEHLKQADESGWRQRDLLAHGRSEVPPAADLL